MTQNQSQPDSACRSKKLDPTTLAKFTGTEHYYRLNRKCLITDGAKYLAEAAAAYWLLEVAATRDPVVNGDIDALMAEVIRHGQILQSPAVAQAVGHKVHAPDLIYLCSQLQRHTLN